MGEDGTGTGDLQELEQGIDRLAETATAADLVRSRGQSRKLQVMSKQALMNYIHSVVVEVTSRHADKLSVEERQAIETEAQRRMGQVLGRAKQMEATLAQKERERSELEARLKSRADSGDHAYRQALAQLQARLAEAEREAEERLQDLLVVEDELAKLQNLHAAARSERDRQNEANKRFILGSTDLVQGVLGLDNDYYAGRHQEANPADETQDVQASFFHDFAVAADVINTLSVDLERLRRVTSAAASDDSSGLLDEDLRLLEELGGPPAVPGSGLDPTALATPLEVLHEAVDGIRKRIYRLHEAVAAESPEATAFLTMPEMPSAAEAPVDHLDGLGRVLQELESQLARIERTADLMVEASADRERLNHTARNQVVRSSELLRTVIDIDRDHYGGRHAAGADQSAGEDAFFHDFVVCEAVLQQLGRDLGRLGGLLADQGIEGRGFSDRVDELLGLVERPVAGLGQADQRRLVSVLDALRATTATIDSETAAATGLGKARLPTPLMPGAGLEDSLGHLDELTAILDKARRRIATLRDLADSAAEQAGGAGGFDEELVGLVATCVEKLEPMEADIARDGDRPNDERQRAAKRAMRRLRQHLRALDRRGDDLERERAVARAVLELVIGDERLEASEATEELALALDMAEEPDLLTEPMLGVLRLLAPVEAEGDGGS